MRCRVLELASTVVSLELPLEPFAPFPSKSETPTARHWSFDMQHYTPSPGDGLDPRRFIAQVPTHPSPAPSPAKTRPAPDRADLSQWLPLRALVAKHPHLLSMHKMEWFMRNRDHNGLAEHVRRVGRDLIIFEPGFVAWLLAKGA
jgi:hypothetical protein